MYSQNHEEECILDAVGADGWFLDIGAFDGKTFSNTLALIERGWSGVMVEPSISGFSAMHKNLGFNPRLILVQAVVGIERSIVPFWPSPDAVSTTSQKHYDRWKESAEFENQYLIPQITTSDLISACPSLRFASVVSIDTEGTSADLFFTFPFDLCTPKVFCVEYDNKLELVRLFASERGYEPVYTSSENVVLVHA